VTGWYNVTVKYDTIQQKSLTWTKKKAECDQLNLAHETKTNKCQCPLSSVQVRDP